MRRNCLLLTLAFFLSLDVYAQSRHARTSRFKSYTGLLMAGYQGWFNAEGDGAGRGWYHYSRGGKFGPGNVKVDLWPETSEYKKLYPAPFELPGGVPAMLPSSYDASTTDLHFKWMAEYGIDGVFMQSFLAEVKNPSGRKHFNTVLSNALAASVKYGRAIAVMYDLSGTNAQDVQTLIDDWKNLVDSMKLTSRGNRQTYLYHRGKPLVALWGVGFNDNRKYTLASVSRMVDFLKNDPVYGGCSVLLGVPTYWRELGNDTEKDPALHTLLKMADIIHPWTVGRFGNAGDYARYAVVQQGDIAWCRENKVDYVPVVFPGFSWHNMNPRSPLNQIGRDGGRFFWLQLYTAIKNGAGMIYVAMFDEIDEGTAIFKISKTPPGAPATFLTFESGIPSDYYLFLAGYAGKMLKGKTALKAEIPRRNQTESNMIVKPGE